MKTDKQIKRESTIAEYKYVFENFNIPGKPIYAKCSDGLYVRKYWQSVGKFGWSKWTKMNIINWKS
jgi:hypothetical protein